MDNSVEDENSSSAKCTLIDKIIGSMKSEFNKNSIKEGGDDKNPEINKGIELEPSDNQTKETEKHSDSNKGENISEVKIENGNLPTKLSKKNSQKSKIVIPSTKEEEEQTCPVTKIEEKVTELTNENSSDSEKEVGYDPIADEFRGFDNKTKNSFINKDTSISTKRSLRSKTNIIEPELKRSTRRRSKDCTESVLQSAIARKEKSYNETVKPQRLSRRLKPTPKILANLEQCQKDSVKNDKKSESKKITSPRISRDRKSSSDKKSESDQKSEEDFSDKQKRKRMLSRSSNKKQKSISNKTNDIQENILESDNSSSSPLEDEDDTKNNSELIINKNKLKRKSSDSSEGKPSRRSIRKIMKNQEENIKPENEEVIEPLSGSVAEQELSPNAPESSSVENQNLETKKCLCQRKSQIYISTSNSSDIVHCAALDSIDGKIIGCNNIVSGELSMLRPSVRIPYIILCEVHKERLIRHNCCPTCGLFCMQGRFIQCPSNHQYHRDCQITIGNASCCPHCGLETPEYDVMVKMHCLKNPVFLPKQKCHYPSAKMSFTKNNSKNEVEKEVRVKSPPLVPPGAIELRYLCNPSEPREKYNLNTLFEAIKDNNCEDVATILGTGDVNLSEEIPNTDGYTLLHYTSHEGLLAIAHMLIVAGSELDLLDKDQNTPLMLAILAFKNTIVKYLIKSGASIILKGTDGMSPLHLAAKSGNLEACHFLLNALSDVINYVNSADDGGWTPLVWACEHGHENVVKYLLQNGADPLLRDVEQNIALHWATFSGSSYITEMLLNGGCGVLAVNAHGDSPLHIAARQDKYNCVLMLLARGANVYLKNKNGESPLDCCVSQPGDCYTAISLNVQLQAITNLDNIRKPTILSHDASKGKEINPIQCINTVDDEPTPIDYIYITKNCFTSDIQLDNKITSLQSCMCEEKCVSLNCRCNHISLGCWYDEEGKLIPEFNYADPPMLFECNPACNCNAITCNNRVVQNGLTQRFQLFRTLSKGWGIKTLRFIPKGAYVCEYIGEILSDSEADHREDDSYLFDLDNRDGETYCIDARRYGNLSRFINHNCEPNLLPARVFIEHQDLRFPRIAFFANRDIDANEELGFDYGEKFWIIKYKSFTCMCGKNSCKYSESTIKTTLENYNRKLKEEAAAALLHNE